MKAHNVPFTRQTLYEAMDAMFPKTRGVVRLTLRDFIRREEVGLNPPHPPLQRGDQRGVFIYLGRSANTSPAGNVRQRIYKAMRLISFKEPFVVSDIRRMTGADRNYIDKLTRKLLEDGHLRCEGYRSRAAGYGKEAVYRVVNMDRFRLEVMR